MDEARKAQMLRERLDIPAEFSDDEILDGTRGSYSEACVNLALAWERFTADLRAAFRPLATAVSRVLRR